MGRGGAVVSSSPLRVTNRREVESRSSGLESSEARQKFAGAKAISSDMFFGREVDSEVSRVVCSESGGSRWKWSFFPAVVGFSTSVARSVLSSWVVGLEVPRPCLFFTTV